jgi:hypothetical protein
VRVPARLTTGYHLAVCLLAGFGAAWLFDNVPRGRGALVAIVLAAALIEVFATTRGTARRFETLVVAPDADALELFETLARMGNSGPILELPLGGSEKENVFKAPPRILMSAYHHRRTSACYGSFLPPGREELRRDALMLPTRAAAVRIRDRGFTTVIVHLDTAREEVKAQLLHDAAADPRSGIRYLASNDSMAAFELLAD